MQDNATKRTHTESDGFEIRLRIPREVTEGCLLQLAEAIYRLSYPNEKSNQAIASHVGINAGTLDKARNDNTHLGANAWLKIDRLIGVQLYERYLEALHDEER